MSTPAGSRAIFTDEHEMFRSAYRSFLDREMVSRAHEWEQAGIVSRDVWTSAGASDFLAFDIPETYGGPGVEDFRYNLVVVEELASAAIRFVASHPNVASVIPVTPVGVSASMLVPLPSCLNSL